MLLICALELKSEGGSKTRCSFSVDWISDELTGVMRIISNHIGDTEPGRDLGSDDFATLPDRRNASRRIPANMRIGGINRIRMPEFRTRERSACCAAA